MNDTLPDAPVLAALAVLAVFSTTAVIAAFLLALNNHRHR